MKGQSKAIRNKIESLLGIKLSDKSQKKELVEARAVYFKLAKEKTNDTLSQIGELVGRHRCSVLHGYTVVFPSLEYYNKELHQLYLDLSGEKSILADVIKKIEELDYNKLLTLNNYLNELTE